MSRHWQTDGKTHCGDGYMRYVPDHIKVTAGPNLELDAGRYTDIAWILTFLTPNAEEYARLIAAAPETAAERDRLRAVNAELLQLAEVFLSYLEDDSHSRRRRFACLDAK